MALAGGYSLVSGTVPTTVETLVLNIPAVAVPIGQQATGQVAIRGNVQLTTGTATSALAIRCRVATGNTTSALLDQTETIPATAGVALSAPYEFIDPAGLIYPSTPSGVVTGNLQVSGYSITVTQLGASGNGSLTAGEYEVEVIGAT